jgi:hypothetical protein
MPLCRYGQSDCGGGKALVIIRCDLVCNFHRHAVTAAELERRERR